MPAQLTPAYVNAYRKVEEAKKIPGNAGKTAADLASEVGVKKAYYYTAKSLMKKESKPEAEKKGTLTVRIVSVSGEISAINEFIKTNKLLE